MKKFNNLCLSPLHKLSDSNQSLSNVKNTMNSNILAYNEMPVVSVLLYVRPNYNDAINKEIITATMNSI